MHAAPKPSALSLSSAWPSSLPSLSLPYLPASSPASLGLAPQPAILHGSLPLLRNEGEFYDVADSSSNDDALTEEWRPLYDQLWSAYSEGSIDELDAFIVAWSAALPPNGPAANVAASGTISGTDIALRNVIDVAYEVMTVRHSAATKAYVDAGDSGIHAGRGMGSSGRIIDTSTYPIG